MAIKYQSGGRQVSQKQFFDSLKRRGIDLALSSMVEKYYAVAASIVDPVSSKHAEVFVRRTPSNGLAISTLGSPAFARELERRLGLPEQDVKTVDKDISMAPSVYLAHASEDHESLARPLAEFLTNRGISVWLDDWEIRTGDSLKQKMEAGLETCTHFIVLLTANSIGKNWVEREIDVGFVRAVDGRSRFMGLRVNVDVSALSPFLQTMRCPAVDLSSSDDLERLVADVFGVSRKPPMGEKPRYVQNKPVGPAGWSPSASIVASHLVQTSATGRATDPEATFESVSIATGLPVKDVRLGVLDLVDGGLIERDDILGSEAFWPNPGLFVEFDRYFMEFNNRDDAIAVANLLVSEEIEEIAVSELANRLPQWSTRRLNSALSYLDAIKAVTAHSYCDGGPWIASELESTDRTLRFVRDNC